MEEPDSDCSDDVFYDAQCTFDDDDEHEANQYYRQEPASILSQGPIVTTSLASSTTSQLPSATQLSAASRQNTSLAQITTENAVIPKKYCERRSIGHGEGVSDSEGISLTRIAKDLLASVRAGADVTNIQLPASILDPVSSLEKGMKAMQRGEILQDMVGAPDSLSRMWDVVRFFLSGLSKETFGKKPYNPILGEVFRGCFRHKNGGGYTIMIAEQVSHHPPVTALHFNNPTLGFFMTSYNAPEPKFWGNSLEIKLKGTIEITLTKVNEVYRITRPTLHMSGFIAGKQRTEFIGPVAIFCPQSEYLVELDFKAKGVLGIRGELHALDGKLVHKKSGETLYTIHGVWDKKVTVKNCKTKEKNVIFDYEAMTHSHSMDVLLPPAEEREETNSLNVWHHCTKALWAGDTTAAGDAKRRVEEEQRRARKERETSGEKHSLRYFNRKADGEGYEVKQEVIQELHPPEAIHPEVQPNGIQTAQSMRAPYFAGWSVQNEFPNGTVNGCANKDGGAPSSSHALGSTMRGGAKGNGKKRKLLGIKSL